MPSSGVQTCRSEEHTSELQSHSHLVCRLLLEKKKRILDDFRSSRTRFLAVKNVAVRAPEADAIIIVQLPQREYSFPLCYQRSVVFFVKPGGPPRFPFLPPRAPCRV